VTNESTGRGGTDCSRVGCRVWQAGRRAAGCLAAAAARADENAGRGGCPCHGRSVTRGRRTKLLYRRVPTFLCALPHKNKLKKHRPRSTAPLLIFIFIFIFFFIVTRLALFIKLPSTGLVLR